MTKRFLILIATCCLLAVPATAVGSTPTQAASTSCKAQLAASGPTDFQVRLPVERIRQVRLEAGIRLKSDEPE